MAFIFVVLLWRSYRGFLLTHLSLTYTAKEDWAKLAATSCLLPTYKSSASTAGCKRGEKAKSYLLGFSLILQQRFYKPVLSFQLHSDQTFLELGTSLGWQQFMRTMQNKWQRPLAQSLYTVTAPSCPGSQHRHTAVTHSYFLEVIFFLNLSVLLSVNFCNKWRKSSLRSRLQVKHLH